MTLIIILQPQNVMCKLQCQNSINQHPIIMWFIRSVAYGRNSGKTLQTEMWLNWCDFFPTTSLYLLLPTRDTEWHNCWDFPKVQNTPPMPRHHLPLSSVCRSFSPGSLPSRTPGTRCLLCLWRPHRCKDHFRPSFQPGEQIQHAEVVPWWSPFWILHLKEIKEAQPCQDIPDKVSAVWAGYAPCQAAVCPQPDSHLTFQIGWVRQGEMGMGQCIRLWRWVLTSSLTHFFRPFWVEENLWSSGGIVDTRSALVFLDLLDPRTSSCDVLASKENLKVRTSDRNNII